MRLKKSLMMKRMRMITKRVFKILASTELLILSLNIISFDFFINLQIAFLSSFFIIIGSAYAYKKMVKSEISSQSIDDSKDPYDTLEDPYDLYDDTPINEASADELDLKSIIKEEKKRIKTFDIKEIKKGSRAGFSLFRLIPYLFLILGFIALRNNELLDLSLYLPSLLLGIIVGYIVSKDLL